MSRYLLELSPSRSPHAVCSKSSSAAASWSMSPASGATSTSKSIGEAAPRLAASGRPVQSDSSTGTVRQAQAGSIFWPAASSGRQLLLAGSFCGQNSLWDTHPNDAAAGKPRRLVADVAALVKRAFGTEIAGVGGADLNRRAARQHPMTFTPQRRWRRGRSADRCQCNLRRARGPCGTVTHWEQQRWLPICSPSI